MKEFIIDFTNIKDDSNAKIFDNFYRTIINGLEFPDWCGDNLDAIWDLITGYMYTPATIKVKGFRTLPKIMNEKGELFLETLAEAKKWHQKINSEIQIEFID